MGIMCKLAIQRERERENGRHTREAKKRKENGKERTWRRNQERYTKIYMEAICTDRKKIT